MSLGDISVSAAVTNHHFNDGFCLLTWRCCSRGWFCGSGRRCGREHFLFETGVAEHGIPEFFWWDTQLDCLYHNLCGVTLSRFYYLLNEL